MQDMEFITYTFVIMFLKLGFFKRISFDGMRSLKSGSFRELIAVPRGELASTVTSHTGIFAENFR